MTELLEDWRFNVGCMFVGLMLSLLYVGTGYPTLALINSAIALGFGWIGYLNWQEEDDDY